MNYRILLIALLWGLPLSAWQTSDKPSPFPVRTPRSGPVTPAPHKSTPAATRLAGQTPPKASTTAGSQRPVAIGETSKYKDSGKACFFSSSVNGELTASGERLHSDEMVAAHAIYPLGSWVKVTNLANGKSVEVRIVDRFPGSSGRVINVSEAAARQLDFISAGTTEVRLEMVRQHTEAREPQ